MIFIEEKNDLTDGVKFLIPVLSDDKIHWSENRLSFIYGYSFDDASEFILNFNHNDASKPQIGLLCDCIGEGNYVYHRKYLGDCGLNYEAELVTWFVTNLKLIFDEDKVIRTYQGQFNDVKNINDCIPIMKWLEQCRIIRDEFLKSFNKFTLTEPFIKYNQLLADLAEIEKNGLFIR